MTAGSGPATPSTSPSSTTSAPRRCARTHPLRLPARIRASLPEHGPQVTGLISIGDSAIHTNPTLGQGIPLALRAADWLARRDLGDPDLAMSYHQWRIAHLRPWFDAQAATDRANQERLRAGIHGAPPPALVGDALLNAALPACSRDDLEVARVRAQVRHLVCPPDHALAEPPVRDRVRAWLRSHPHFDGVPEGPDRSLWDAATRISRSTTQTDPDQGVSADGGSRS